MGGGLMQMVLFEGNEADLRKYIESGIMAFKPKSWLNWVFGRSNRRQCAWVMRDYVSEVMYFCKRCAYLHRLEKIRSIIRIIGRTQMLKQELFRTHCYIEI
jgi:hypothetical protein